MPPMGSPRVRGLHAFAVFPRLKRSRLQLRPRGKLVCHGPAERIRTLRATVAPVYTTVGDPHAGTLDESSMVVHPLLVSGTER